MTRELLGRAVGGGRESEEAWHRLIARVQSRLRVLLSFRLGGGQDAEDLLQEVWLQALQSLDRFEYRGPGSLQRWLAGILRMKLREVRRSACLLYTSPSPRDGLLSRMPSSA